MNHLIYINGLGPNYKGDNIYEFIFSSTENCIRSRCRKEVFLFFLGDCLLTGASWTQTTTPNSVNIFTENANLENSKNSIEISKYVEKSIKF